MLLRDAGVAIYRDGWSRDADWLCFKCGPMGAGNCAHGHADLLQVLWACRGLPRLVDRGTPTYNADDELRHRSTSTPAHNTVSVDGHSQAMRVARFRWERPAYGQDLETRHDAVGWRAAGTVRYEADGHGVTHTREIRYGPLGAEMVDEVDCAGEHRVSATLLFAGTLDYDSETNRLTGPGAGACRIEAQGWERIDAAAATFSPVYGASEPATRLTFSTRMTDHLRGTIRIAADE